MKSYWDGAPGWAKFLFRNQEGHYMWLENEPVHVEVKLFPTGIWDIFNFVGKYEFAHFLKFKEIESRPE